MTKRELETSLASLQDTVKSVFGMVAEALPALFQDELDLALQRGKYAQSKVRTTTKERATARRYLIDAIERLTEVEDLRKTPLDDLTQGWDKVTLERNLDGTSTPDTATPGDNVIDGTGEWLLPSGDSGDTDSPPDGGRG